MRSGRGVGEEGEGSGRGVGEEGEGNVRRLKVITNIVFVGSKVLV